VVKVLIDLRMVRGPPHGIARYALELARRIPRLEPSWTFVAVVGPEGLAGDLADLAPHIPLARCTSDFLAPLEQGALARVLFKEHPTLFHATSFSLPALWPGRLVATIHDANHLAVSESKSLTRTAYYRLVVAPRARRAKALITVSEFSRREIALHLGLPMAQLEVIHNGVDPSFHVPAPAVLQDFRRRRGLPPQYFAAIGNTKAFKNLAVLKSIIPRLPAPLALLAGRGARRALGFPGAVLELAPLPDADLVCFYAGALAVFAPSRYEGFGLPAIEAMACGTPVIAANAGAHPEVVGSADILISPDDPSAWLDAALEVHHNETLRRSLSDKGWQRAARFSWDECARRTLEVYRRALASA
jgi:glycosyltransferase involved in cell wall biosynthesis